MIAPGLGWAQRQRGRDPESRQGKAGEGSARRKAGNGDGRDGARGGTRRQEPTLGQ